MIVTASCSHTNTTLLPLVEDAFSDGSLQFVVDPGTQQEMDDFANKLRGINSGDVTEFVFNDGVTKKKLAVDQITSFAKIVSQLELAILEQKEIESLKLQKRDVYVVELKCDTELLGLAFTSDYLIYDMVGKKAYTCTEDFVRDMVKLYKRAV